MVKKKSKKEKVKKKEGSRTTEIVYSKSVRGKKGVRKKPSSFPRPKYEELMPLKKSYFPDKVVLSVPNKKILSKKFVNKVLLFLIFLLIIVLLLIVGVLSYGYFKNPREYLETNDNVKRAFVSEGVLYVELVDELSGVSEVRFIFLGYTEYYAETSEIKLNYQFVPSDLGLHSFDGFEKVSAVFE